MTKNEATQILALKAQLLDAKKCLRDEFAMAALTGFLCCDIRDEWDKNNLAATSYKYADAMMEARKK
jgi:hypothetical protein